MHQPINEQNRREFFPHVAGFDPDLMYVECKHCGRPVVWTKGRTSQVLQGADVEHLILDASCMILTHGCPRCVPGETRFRLQVVQVDDVYADEQNSHSPAHA